jgi:hypothetical protein
MGDTTNAGPWEMDQAHRERVCRLLFESGIYPVACTQTQVLSAYNPPGAWAQNQFLSAYNAVLAKDLLGVMTELLEYKRAETHR